MLHRLQLRQLTPRQTLLDVQMTPQEWKPDPEVSIKHDDLYARAWECDYERPIFDAEYDNAEPLNSSETAVRSDLPTGETWSTRGTSRERSPELFAQTDDFCDATDTFSHIEPDAQTKSD